jgi:hypothetical protein
MYIAYDVKCLQCPRCNHMVRLGGEGCFKFVLLVTQHSLINPPTSSLLFLLSIGASNSFFKQIIKLQKWLCEYPHLSYIPNVKDMFKEQYVSTIILYVSLSLL